jgi:steroid delta-isomerase-like uncharacterized protein
MPPRTTTRTVLCIFLALATLAAIACANQSTRSSAMSDQNREENRRSVETLFETGFNQGDLGLLDRLVSPDYVGPLGEKGPAGFRGVVTSLRGAFPDIHYTLDDVIAENDRVAVRWHWTGTHKAQFRTYPATGKVLTNTGAGIFQFKDGKIIAANLETDRLGFLMQVGALPPNIVPGPRPAAPPAAQ